MAIAEALSALKSAVYSVQLGLLEGVSTDEHLQSAGRVLIQSEYADVVTERSIVKLCGFPLCSHSLPDDPPRQGRYRISLREHKVFDLQETRLFCCGDCLTASKTFAASLPAERDALVDRGRAVELAAAFRKLTFLGSAQHVQPGIQEVPSIEEEKSSDERPKIEDALSFILIREQNLVHTENFDKPGPFGAVEGYVPHKEDGLMRAKESSAEGQEQPGSPRRQNNSEKHEICKRKASSGKIRSGGKSRVGLDNTRSSGSAKVLSNTVISSILLDGQQLPLAAQEVTAQALQPQRKQRARNRVSWADQNDRKLVEGEALPSTSDHNVIQESKVPESFDLTRFGNAQGGSLISPNLNSRVTNDTVVGRNLEAWPDDTESIARQRIPEQQSFEVCKEQSFDLKSERLGSAEALAAALAKAAEAVAHGYAEPAEAVASAGISILSTPHEELPSTVLFQRSRYSTDGTVEFPENVTEGSHISPADECEEFDSGDCWYSVPPKDFKPEFSTFGTMWMALDGWISAASICHLYGREASEEDNFTSINGKEYLRQVRRGDGVTAEIERTMASCISRVLPGLVEALRLRVSISTLEQALGQCLRTMSLVEALPPFGSKQWRVVVVLLLDALSVHRFPALRNHLLNNRTQIHKVLDSSNLTEAEYEVFRDLILPMGIHPEFAAHCGG